MIFTSTELEDAYDDRRRAPRGRARLPRANVLRARVRGARRSDADRPEQHDPQPRAPHAARPPLPGGAAPEIKLVRCTRGSIFLVMVDLRPESPSRRRVAGRRAEPRATGGSSYVPEGFAQGYQTLEDDTEVLYHMSHQYVPEAARGRALGRPAFGIAWPPAETAADLRPRSGVARLRRLNVGSKPRRQMASRLGTPAKSRTASRPACARRVARAPRREGGPREPSSRCPRLTSPCRRRRSGTRTAVLGSGCPKSAVASTSAHGAGHRLATSRDRVASLARADVTATRRRARGRRRQPPRKRLHDVVDIDPVDGRVTARRAAGDWPRSRDRVTYGHAACCRSC